VDWWAKHILLAASSVRISSRWVTRL